MFEVEVLDRAGRRRPGMWTRLMRVFPGAFGLVARQGETINVALGLRTFWLVPVRGRCAS